MNLMECNSSSTSSAAGSPKFPLQLRHATRQYSQIIPSCFTMPIFISSCSGRALGSQSTPRIITRLSRFSCTNLLSNQLFFSACFNRLANRVLDSNFFEFLTDFLGTCFARFTAARFLWIPSACLS